MASALPAILAYLESGAEKMEDCLNLNVCTPSLKGPNQAPLLVLLYLHGGGFVKYVGERSVIMRFALWTSRRKGAGCSFLFSASQLQTYQ